MTRRYIDDANEQGDVVLPAGEYDVEVVDARANRTNNDNGDQLWLTLVVLNGPDKGKGTELGVFMPDERGTASRMFMKKASALIPLLKKANAGGDDDFIDTLTESLIGFQFTATLGIQGGDSPYAGSQELKASSTLNGTVTSLEDTRRESEAAVAVTSASDDVPF